MSPPSRRGFFATLFSGLGAYGFASAASGGVPTPAEVSGPVSGRGPCPPWAELQGGIVTLVYDAEYGCRHTSPPGGEGTRQERT